MKRTFAARCARIVRIRTVAHQVAGARHAQATVAATKLAQIAKRLQELRTALPLPTGLCSGQGLAAIDEMATRLNDAHVAIEAPIRAAETDCAQLGAEMLRLKHQQDRAAERYQAARLQTVKSVELRADANRLHRKCQPSIGELT